MMSDPTATNCFCAAMMRSGSVMLYTSGSAPTGMPPFCSMEPMPPSKRMNLRCGNREESIGECPFQKVIMMGMKLFDNRVGLRFYEFIPRIFSESSNFLRLPCFCIFAFSVRIFDIRLFFDVVIFRNRKMLYFFDFIFSS